MRRFILLTTYILIINTLVSAQTCEQNGYKSTLLFKEDFGGNHPSDIWLKDTPIPEVLGLEFLKDGQFGVTGVYSIRKRSAGSNQWYNNYSDHTYPNDTTRGYLLQIDGSSESSGQFYGCRIDSLCTGSELYLSMWGMSAVKTSGWSNAYLRMVVEDTLGNRLAYKDVIIYNQKGIWEQFGLSFKVPVGKSSIVYRILNNTSNYGGNDFMLDDIEIRICSPSVNVDIQTDPCLGDQFQLTGSLLNESLLSKPFVYRWLYSPTGNMRTDAQWTTLSQEPVLKLNPVHYSDSGFYRLAISSLNGSTYKNCSAISDPYILKVQTCPSLPPVYKTVKLTACDSLVYHRIVYKKNVLLANIDTVFSPTAHYPDTIKSFDINILQLSYFQIFDTICSNEAYSKYGFQLGTSQTTEPGTKSYHRQLQNSTGCDSLITLYLTIKVSNSLEICDTVKQGDKYTQNGFNIENTQTQTSGVKTFKNTLTNQFGCDSVVTLKLWIKPFYHTVDTLIIQACDNYTLNGQSYSQSGIYIQTLKNITGGDSILVLKLTINTSSTQTITQTACDEYYWNGILYNKTGRYQQRLFSKSGCDSTVWLFLTLLKPYLFVVADTSEFCQTHRATLTAHSNLISKQWNTGETTSIIHIDKAGTYTIKAFQGDCEVLQPISVHECLFDIYIPNAISPDATLGINDEFYIASLSDSRVKTIQFYLYNRWGNLVFSSQDPYFKWDGCENGKVYKNTIYSYKLNVNFTDGTFKKYSGTVTVL